jgi:hypothetical protein
VRAPLIDSRNHDDIAAWIEQLARCERAVPGPGLVGATLAADVVDPQTLDSRFVASAGATVDADLAKTIGALEWLDVAGLFVGGTLGRDVANPANLRVLRAGTPVDIALGATLADLARVVGPEVLVGHTLTHKVPDPLGPHIYEPGVVVDADLAGIIDRLAWVRVRTWRPRDDEPDPGRALMHIAGRFAELVAERVNRAAERHELAFLNLTGAQPRPPRPARVPLTFALAPSSPVDAIVPAGTQVTASPLDGEDGEVVFETDRGLVVTRSQLQAVMVGDTETDAWSDRSDRAKGEVDAPFAAFDGDRPMPHALYLACDPLLAQPGAKDVILTLRSSQTWQWANWPISWAYWDGTAWQTVAATAALGNGMWVVTINGLPAPQPTAVAGTTASWLRARLDMPLPPGRGPVPPESVALGTRQPEDLDLPLAPFGDPTQNKFLYLSVDDAVGAGRMSVRCKVALARRGTGDIILNWTYRVGTDWRPLGQSSSTAPFTSSSSTDFTFRDGTQAFTRDGDITFYAPATWPRGQFKNRVGRWLRVEIDDKSGAYKTLPVVRALDVTSGWELPQVGATTVRVLTTFLAQAPPAGAFNNTVLDLTKDFYPFGEEPRFNDTWYLALPENLARPKSVLRLQVTLTNPSVGTSVVPKPVFAAAATGTTLTWEVWDGQRWHAVTVDDGTKSLTASGGITVTLPDTVAPTTVEGEDGRWLRARMTSGNYGEPADYTTGTDAQKNTIYLPKKATFAPPVIKTVMVEPVTAKQPEAPVSACMTTNGFLDVNQTVPAAGLGGTFAPFTPTPDPAPALYLAFDQPFAPRPTTLYLQVEPPLPEDVAADQLAELDRSTLATVSWEYLGPDGWRPLGAVDETQALARRGLVSFVGPDDMTEATCYGQDGYWLRARWQHGAFPLPPRLRRVLLNTTWATQVVSVADEILGSSNGHPDQVFTTAQAPVQPGQQLLVRERDQPPADEATALVELVGADAVQVTLDAAGDPDEVWVRWQPVPDLYGSWARDRHYVIDPLTGEVRFGDGQHGLVPPPGQNNVRISYQTGGGEQGNRAAATIVQLSSGVPYIDGVTNHEPSEGGAPREPIDRLRGRAPRALRHGDRAITAQDLEDLAYEASTDVARALAVTPQFDPNNLWLDTAGARPTAEHRDADPGRMGVIVVPDSQATRPTPSLGLLSDVQSHLGTRCPPTADLWVAGPEWVQVAVTATIAARSLDVADAAALRVRSALERFLHPLTGGPLGEGWAFGRKPHRSDLYALIEGIDGVDHVVTLEVDHEPETQDPNRHLALQRMLDQTLAEASTQPPDPELQRWLDRALVYSGVHRVTVALDRLDR